MFERFTDRARRVVVLTDSSKIGVETTHRFAKSGEYHMLVTDDGIDDDERKALEDTGVEVVIA